MNKACCTCCAACARTARFLAPPIQSVLGIGAFARERGASIACVTEAGMEAWLASPKGEAQWSAWLPMQQGKMQLRQGGMSTFLMP
jgi:hypothetical protein